MRWPWSRKGGPVETVSVRGRGDVRRGAGWVKPVAPPSSEAQPGGLPPKPPQRVEVRRFAEFQDAMSPGEEAELHARFERQWPRRPAVLSDPVRIRPVGVTVCVRPSESRTWTDDLVAAADLAVDVTFAAVPGAGDQIEVLLGGSSGCVLLVVDRVVWQDRGVRSAVVYVRRPDDVSEQEWPEVFEALRERA